MLKVSGKAEIKIGLEIFRKIKIPKIYPPASSLFHGSRYGLLSRLQGGNQNHR
jgi:hypothetical protein